MQENKVPFFEVMKANNFLLEQKNNTLFIKKSKSGGASTRNKIALLVVGLIVGLIFFFFINGRTGIFILFIIGGLLFSQMNMRQREKEGEKKVISINQEGIEIKEGYKSKRIKNDDIIEFKTDVYPFEKKFVGKVTVNTENKKSYEFLEIYGEDEISIQQDLLILAHFLVDTYMSDEEETEEET